MLARPKLVVDDPWLEPHELVIQRRIARFEGELAAIEKEFGSIRDHADAHCRFGVNADSAWEAKVAKAAVDVQELLVNLV